MHLLSRSRHFRPRHDHSNQQANLESSTKWEKEMVGSASTQLVASAVTRASYGFVSAEATFDPVSG